MDTLILDKPTVARKSSVNSLPQLASQVAASFATIAPYWPLKNIIAVNPLQGFESLPIEEALQLGEAFFQQPALPEPMEAINRQTIKWLQSFLEQGQATLPMPYRSQGLYHAWRQLAPYDACLHGNDPAKKQWLKTLPEQPIEAISTALLQLGISQQDQSLFLTLALTTLPGWASYIRYRTNWAGLEANHPHPITQVDYMAFRLIITCLLWPQAKDLLIWHQQNQPNAQNHPKYLASLETAEKRYRLPLLNQLAAQTPLSPHIPQAQFVFCIDVRSEPFRRALEAAGDYQTLGFAGFFGIPVQLTDTVTGESYASCPVLLSPKHQVEASPCCTPDERQQDSIGYKRLTTVSQLYQSLKYTFTTPFALVESLGFASGAWMGLRSLAPRLAAQLKERVHQLFRKHHPTTISLAKIPVADQCQYAEGALRTMGLTQQFAPLVVFCGHGSTTQNNAYASALDCGACGGRHGGSNAQILADILNTPVVRTYLHEQGISIPESTLFAAAEHNTTTDEVTLLSDIPAPIQAMLKAHLAQARATTNHERLKQLAPDGHNSPKQAQLRAQDWAQVRPEWGLARNAAFIAAPRWLTVSLNLEGRCFLHSYNYTQDPKGAVLTTILTAPMVVAQWINAQYLFSTLDNVAFGGGSKITQNITGKIGVMQGNGSDLMTGLPLQSVYAQDNLAYHEPQRLMTVVYAPMQLVDSVVRQQPILQTLAGNGWVQLVCLNPENHMPYLLNRALEWQPIH